MKHTKSRATIYCFRNNDTKIALRSKATFSLLFSLLSFLWKRQFERREKNEKRKVKRTKRNDNLPKENCRFFLVCLEGFEPPTYWFVASYSIQLSYRHIFSMKEYIPNSEFCQAIFKD